MLPRLVLAALGALLMTTPALPAPFGKTADGTPVETFTLTNKNESAVVSCKLMPVPTVLVMLELPPMITLLLRR